MRKTGILGLLLILVISAQSQIIEPPFIKNLKISVRNVKGVNTPASEISPVIVKGQLFYSSIPSENYVEWRLKRNIAFYDTYNAGFLPLYNDVVAPRPIVEGIKNYNIGPGSWCEATGEFFVSLTNEINIDEVSRLTTKVDSRLKLAIMKQVKGKWKITEELPFNDDDYNFGHPAINKTGDTLVFASDYKEGNQGQTDLYMSVRKNGKWSFPENLGNKINTKGQEMFPSFVEGFLTFSSNGQPINYGNLDIYYTTFPKIDKIRNIGGRINTQNDDFGLVIEPNGTFGYFASNRPGGPNVGEKHGPDDDIYRIDIDKSILANKTVKTNEPVQTPEPVLMPGDSLNKPNNRLNIEDNTLSLNTDVSSKNPIVTPDKTSVNSTPEVKNTIAQKENTTSVASNNQGIKVISEKPTESQPLPVAEKPNVDKTITKLPENQNINIIESDDTTRFLKCRVFDAKTRKPVQLASVSYNNFNWLTDENGVSEIPFNELQKGIIVISREGYRDVVFDVSKIDGNNLEETIYLQSAASETPVTLKSIFYDFDKWNIKPEAREILDELVTIMNANRDLKIELSSHADSRGSQSYNMVLTEKRSNSAMNYITNKGISYNRMTAINYGETKLVNNCADGVKCTEAEHAQNRRTDFRIIEGLLSLENTPAGKTEISGTDDNGLFYTVQVLALTRQPSAIPVKYKEEKNMVQKQIGGFAKFFVGQYDSYASAVTRKNSLKSKFKDAFVVAIRNGEVIQICDLNKKIVNNETLVLK